MEDNIPNLEEELASFRQEWHNELTAGKRKENKSSNRSKVQSEDTPIQGNGSIEEKAAKLFQQGVRLEKDGQFNAAVQYYRQAVRLVPDIEFKILSDQIAVPATYQFDSSDEDTDGHDDIDLSVDPLCKQINDLNVTGLCSPALPQKETHISSLPTELLIVVVQWIVSKDLDICSLGRFSEVCKWFYSCARDEELWKSICQRIWGKNCVKIGKINWRKMFIERPHLKYSGIYISTNTYIRIGEQSLDSFYRPCHLVEYYRYLRFFTDGSVLIYTSPDEPELAIQMLSKPPYRDPSINKGYYRIASDNDITIFYSVINKPQVETRRRKRRGEIDPSQDVKEYNFTMQCTLKDLRRSKNSKILVNDYHYTMYNRRTRQKSSENEISVKEIKPYIYSPVRSYSAKSYGKL